MINTAFLKSKKSLPLSVFFMLWLITALFVSFYLPSSVAAESYSNASCANKVNEDDCKKAVAKECTSTVPDRLEDCRKLVIERFKDANGNTSCQTKINKANCEKAVKDECSTSPNKEQCQRNTISRFKDKAGQGPSAGAKDKSGPVPTLGKNVKNSGGDTCGNNEPTQVKTKFNFGCLGNDVPGNELSPIEDVIYSIIRFLSAGVGIVVVLAIIMSGIKYSSSEGNPEATQDAKNKIRAALIGLLIYIFTFSLIQYLVPGGVFN